IMPASSNRRTVRYTVEIEMRLSTLMQRRYSSSTSGWSSDDASTRAMVRRCSVMRMPLAAHSASILVLSVAGVVAINPILSQRASEITAQNERRRRFAASALIITGPPRHLAKAGAVVKLVRSGVVLVDFEK